MTFAHLFAPLLAAMTALAPAPAAREAASVTARPAPPRPVPCVGACWRPAAATRLHMQLQGTPTDAAVADVQLVELDAVETPASTVRDLHAGGRHVSCYINAGAWERWRPDAASFPAAIRGTALDGWPGERWLDVRDARLRPILVRRVADCAKRGFDAVEFDNVDGYTQDSGFPITAADQLRFNRWLADTAHRAGLAVGLKNDPDQVPQLVRWFDFAVVEQCFQYRECASFAPFATAGKPVFVLEYSTPLRSFCAAAKRARLSAGRYPLLLDGDRAPCPWPPPKQT